MPDIRIEEYSVKVSEATHASDAVNPFTGESKIWLRKKRVHRAAFQLLLLVQCMFVPRILGQG